VAHQHSSQSIFLPSEGFNVFFRWYNALSSQLIEADGLNYTLELKVTNNSWLQSSINSSYNNLVNTATGPQFLFAPFGTSQSQYAATVADKNDSILFSSTAGVANWNAAYKYAFSNLPLHRSYVDPTLCFVRVGFFFC